MVPVSGLCGRRVVAVGGEHEVSGVDCPDDFGVLVARAAGLRARCLWRHASAVLKEYRSRRWTTAVLGLLLRRSGRGVLGISCIRWPATSIEIGRDTFAIAIGFAGMFWMTSSEAAA